MAPRMAADDRRAAALDAARDILDREGLAGLGARPVAKATGCSVGTLYNTFGHLDGLVRALAAEALDALHARMEAVLAEGGGLDALAQAYLDFALERPGRWEALFRYRPQTEADGEVAVRVERLFALVARAAPNLDEAARRTLWAAVHGVVDLSASGVLGAIEGTDARRMLGRVVGAMG